MNSAPPKLPYEKKNAVTNHAPSLDNFSWKASDRSAAGRVSQPQPSNSLGPREEVSEEVLERQIEELSGYLDDEVKSRRASKGFVAARNSIGSHNSSSSSLSAAPAVQDGRSSSSSRPTTPTGRPRFS